MTMFNAIMDMGLCMHVCIFVEYSNKLVLNLNLNLNISEILIEINTYSFTKMHLEMLFVKCGPFRISLIVLKITSARKAFML